MIVDTSGYLYLSTKDGDGNWHSDSENVKEAIEDLSFTDLAAIIGKIVLGWGVWKWVAAVAAAAICTACATVVGCVACVLAIIALELASIVIIIAIIEEVTGNYVNLTSASTVNSAFGAGNYGTALTGMASMRNALVTEANGLGTNPESTEGGRLVSILKWPEGAPLNLG